MNPRKIMFVTNSLLLGASALMAFLVLVFGPEAVHYSEFVHDRHERRFATAATQQEFRELNDDLTGKLLAAHDAVRHSIWILILVLLGMSSLSVVNLYSLRIQREQADR